jgi:hypothetical protein
VELIAAYKPVLGVDVSTDITKKYDRWQFDSAFAFAPGDWMKHLVEMAAFIDAHQSHRFSSYIDEDVLRRASKINL